MITERLCQYFLFLGLLLTLLSPVFSANYCIIPEEEHRILSMPYDEFDQKKDGWRHYATVGCYHEIGALIDKYLEKNEKTLSDWQLRIITWHAGQLYASNNEYELAQIRFEHSVNKNEPKNLPILWNDYVYATIAFLNNDRPKLIMHRNKIANGPSLNGKKSNLDVVDSLIRYLGEPYSKAYRSTSH